MLGGFANRSLLRGVRHDHEMPGLAVGAARRASRREKRVLNDVLRNLPVGKVPYRAAPTHETVEPLRPGPHLVDRMLLEHKWRKPFHSTAPTQCHISGIVVAGAGLTRISHQVACRMIDSDCVSIGCGRVFREHFFGERHVRCGTGRVAVVEDRREAVARRLRQPHVPGYDRAKDLVAEIVDQLTRHFERKAGPGVEHRPQNAFDGEPRVAALARSRHRVEQRHDAFEA